MTKEQFEEFAPLWGSEATYFVIESMDPNNQDLRRCGIFDRRHKSVVLIEDPELALEVMRRMVDAGVEIVNTLPEHGFDRTHVEPRDLGVYN